MPRKKTTSTAEEMPKQKSSYALGALGYACSKTKLCLFYSQGFCSRGAGCNFAHGEAELKDAPDLTRTKMCPKLVKFGECKRVACKHAHSDHELRPMNEALPRAGAALALAAEWQRRNLGGVIPPGKGKPDVWEISTIASDCSLSEAGSSEMSARGNSQDFGGELTPSRVGAMSPKTPRSEEKVVRVETSFIGASRSEHLVEGSRLFHASTGLQLAIRNTFFDLDEPARASAMRRSHSCF